MHYYEKRTELNRAEGMTPNARLLFQAAWVAAKAYPLLPGLHYTSPYDFVARHGVEYAKCFFAGTTGAPSQCYGNSIIQAAINGWRYVEGFAVSPTGLVIAHAWNVDDKGYLNDCTWRNGGAAYIGVEFSVERADDATWNGDACILNDEHRNYPIFQKLWTGEDYTLSWPYSDRLAMMRAGCAKIPASVQNWLIARRKGESTDGRV